MWPLACIEMLLTCHVKFFFCNLWSSSLCLLQHSL